jgi:hypothetical protein
MLHGGQDFVNKADVSAVFTAWYTIDVDKTVVHRSKWGPKKWDGKDDNKKISSGLVPGTEM